MRLLLIVAVLGLICVLTNSFSFSDNLRDGFLRFHHRLTTHRGHYLQKRALEEVLELENGEISKPSEDKTNVVIPSNATRRIGSAKLTIIPCGDEDDQMYLEYLDVKPNPVIIPGPLNLLFRAGVKRNTSSPLAAELFMKKKVALLFGLSSWFDIPCLDHPSGKVGSCEYDDICGIHLLNHGLCPIRDDIKTCGCPLIEGVYQSKDLRFDIPEIPEDIPPYLLEGEFEVKIVLKKDTKHVACLSTHIDLSVSGGDPSFKP